MLKLTGIVEDVFGGRTVFRGYATLRTLYKLSQSSDYQRKEDKARLPAICNFLQNSPFRFYPELLFAWQIEENEALIKLKFSQTDGTINFNNGISIKKAKFTFQKTIGDEPKTKVITINIPDTEISKKPFVRLDGNHRLSALKELYDQETKFNKHNELLDMIVPFSVLLQIKGEEAEKFESAFFYLINSKARALTTEENLHAIFEKDFFTNEERIDLLEISSVNTLQEYISNFKFNKYKIISEIFENEIYTLSLELLSIIKNANIPKVISSIQYINACYENKELKTHSKNIVLSLIKVRSEKDFYTNFFSWIQRLPSNVFDEIKPEKIVSLYEDLISKKLEVFVAMPYFGEDKIKEYNKIYKDAIDVINKQYGTNIYLNKIMSNTGNTSDQIKDILDKIFRCDIFFSDITDNNANVTYEMGWARALNKKVIILKEKNSEKPKSDYANDTYHIYDKESPNITLKTEIEKNLSTIIENDYHLVRTMNEHISNESF